MKTGQKAPAPRQPAAKRITHVAELLPRARELVSRKAANMYEGFEVKKGQKVLIINEPSADQLVVEAFATASRERGATVDIIGLQGFGPLKDAAELLDNMFSNNWYPDWAWAAANEADIVLLTAFLKKPHTPIPPLPGNPKVENIEITSDLMLSEYLSFPVELRDAIDDVAWENMGHASQLRWTDLEGTDLTIHYKPQDWKKLIDRNTKGKGAPYPHGHLMFPAPVQDMNGVYVSSSITFGGPVPRTTLKVEGGRVVDVQGGGKFGDRLRTSFEKYKDLTGKSCPGPGINWITTMGLCTNPKAARSPFFEELSGSARIFAWTYAHRRSGVLHASIGEGKVTPNYKVIRHMDTFFNTLVTEKGTIAENGRLCALDDPRVREMAARFGDPDQLLQECWIPAVSGVNVP
ncbi:MAG: hypothetical protein Q8P24_14005 [Desulfobacterales bacterium]|nr:hypothetical protein [Desulfobacterales bacterium]